MFLKKPEKRAKKNTATRKDAEEDSLTELVRERLVGSILKRLRILCCFFGKILKLSLLNFGLLRF